MKKKTIAAAALITSVAIYGVFSFSGKDATDVQLETAQSQAPISTQATAEFAGPTTYAPDYDKLSQKEAAAPPQHFSMTPEAAMVFSSDNMYYDRGLLLANADRNLNIRIESADQGRNFILEAARDSLGLSEADGLEIKTSNSDHLGNNYYKYSQTYDGLPVFGRELVLQTRQDNSLVTVMGQFEKDFEVNTVAELSGDLAVSSFFSDFGQELVGGHQILEEPTLMIYTSDQVPPTLAYRSLVQYTSYDKGFRVEELFVDAHTGKKVDAISAIHGAAKLSVHNYNNQCISQRSMNLPGPRVDDPANGHQHVQDAYKHSGITYNFYHHQFGRNSFDDRGGTIVSTVLAQFDFGRGCSGDNAMYFTAQRQFVYGTGGSLLSNPAGALDIVAHEITHGVTHADSDLTYQNESGALNEAMSDIFAAGTEAWYHSGGTAEGNPAGGIQTTKDNWTMGEDAALDLRMKRFMYDPTKDGHSRDNYPERYIGQENNGGVHSNNGIGNLAFYLLSEGGTHPRDKSDVDVQGIGIEKALQIAYLANNRLMTKSTNFQGARATMAQAAINLYGECSDEWHSVHQAFDAVLVPGSWTPCDTGGGDTGGGDTGGGDTGGGDTGGGDTGGGDTGGGDTGGGDTGGGDTGGGDTGGGDTGGTTPPPPPPPVSNVNFALGGNATASSMFSWAWAPRNLNDGSMNTNWASRYKRSAWDSEEWVRIFLNNNQEIGTVKIDWAGSQYPRTVSVWVVGPRGWMKVADHQATGGPSEIRFNPVSTRDVMVRMTNFNANYVVISQMGLYR